MPVLPPSKPITLASYHRLEKLGNTHTNPIQMFSCSSFHPSPSTNNTNKNPLKIFHLCGKPASCTQSSLAYAPSTSTILCLSPLISSVHASIIPIEHTKTKAPAELFERYGSEQLHISNNLGCSPQYSVLTQEHNLI